MSTGTAAETPLPPALPQLQSHLTDLATSTPPPDLDVKLVETLTAQVTDVNTPPLIPLLVPSITAALQSLNTDPAPLTTLLLRLLRPVSFSELLSITSAEQILSTLLSPSPPVQLLGLALLEKAAASPSEAGTIASWPEVVRRVITLSLAADDTGVASKAADVLVDLLKADSIESGGAGLVWRRCFSEEAGYRVFFDLTKEDGTTKGRLLGLVLKLSALDWELMCRCRIEAVEGIPAGQGREREYGGLLLYAATRMVPDHDTVLQMLLIDFYTALFASAKTRAKEFLTLTGTVQKCVTLLEAEEATVEQSLLRPHAASFAAKLVELFPDELEKGLGEKLVEICRRDPQATESFELLKAMGPFVATRGIVPGIPLSPPLEPPLRTLAHLFKHEQVYHEYVAAHPELWELVTSYAATPALGAVALAALQLIENVATAGDWGVRELVGAPGVLGMLVEPPKRFLGGEVEGWRVLRRRWEVVGVVAEKVGGRWGERLRERYRAGVVERGAWEGGEVATMEM